MLIKFNYIFNTLLLSLVTFSCYASMVSNESQIFEKVFVHVNRNILLSGSELKYAAYITNETNNDVSSIIYFEIIDCNGMVVIDWKSKANNNLCEGSQIIPESINSGIYFLRAYTNKIRNYPSKAIFSIPLIIQRIYEDPMDTICIPESISVYDSTSNYDANANNWIHVSLDESSDFRLTITANARLKSAEISISVTEIPDIQIWKTLPNFKSFTNIAQSVLLKEKPAMLPQEDEYSLICGRLSYLPDSVPVANKDIYLAYPDSTIHFKYFKTTDSGEFCFLIDSTFDNKQLYLQVFDLECKKDSMIWEIDNKSLSTQTILHQKNTKASENQKEYIDQLQKREIINRVYNATGKTQKNFAANNFIPNIFQKPTYVVKPSDFVELTNFQDICDNIIPSIRFRVANNKVQIGIVINQQVIYNDVLICVNGLPCFNMNYIENLTSKDINRIEIFNEVFMYGDLTFNGVIGIYTNKNEVDERAFCNPYLPINNNFYTENKNIQESKPQGTIPNVNPDIFWDNSIELNSGEIKVIAFPKPEIGSNYMITINGLINNVLPYGYQQLISIDK